MEVRGGWGKEERGGGAGVCSGNSGRIVRVPTKTISATVYSIRILT